MVAPSVVLWVAMKAASKELLLAVERVEKMVVETVEQLADTRADQMVVARDVKMVAALGLEKVDQRVAYSVEKSADQLGLMTDSLST